MASKLCLILLAATSLALLLVADASILRTTSVTEIEEENPSKGSCSQQLRGMSLTPCLNWMKHSSSGGGSGAELEEVEDMTRQGSSSQQYKKQCCNMMKQFEDEECMCSALKNTVREKCMSGQGRRTEICGERMTEKLMSVPMMCGLMNEKCQYRMLVI